MCGRGQLGSKQGGLTQRAAGRREKAIEPRGALQHEPTPACRRTCAIDDGANRS